MTVAQTIFWGLLIAYALIAMFVMGDNARLNASEPDWYPKPSALRLGLLWLPLAVLEAIHERRRPRA